LFESGNEVGSGLEAVGGIFGNEFAEEGIDGFGDIDDLREGGNRLADVGEDGVDCGFAGEEDLACEEEVEGAAEAVEISAGIGGTSVAGLFRGHEGGGPHDHAGLGELSSGGIVGGIEPGESHIKDFDDTGFVAEEIGGVDIAMDDALFVSMVERHESSEETIERGLERERTSMADELIEIGTGDEFGDEVVNSPVFAGVEGGDDVGMVQACDGADFAIKAAEEFGVALDFGAEDLDGDGPVHSLVESFVDGSHSAAANALEDFVISQLIGDGDGVWRTRGDGGFKEVGEPGAVEGREAGEVIVEARGQARAATVGDFEGEQFAECGGAIISGEVLEGLFDGGLFAGLPGGFVFVAELIDAEHQLFGDFGEAMRVVGRLGIGHAGMSFSQSRAMSWSLRSTVRTTQSSS